MTGETRREWCKWCKRIVWVVRRNKHTEVCAECGRVV